jgi:hypothetical protein
MPTKTDTQMASCLDALIGTDYGCTTTAGRLYLKDIGITEEFLANLVKRHNSTIADYIGERKRIAIERVRNNVVSHYNSAIIPKTFVDAARLGVWPDTEVLEAVSAGYRNGIFIEVCTPASNTRINISALEFYGETTGTVTATVFDLRDGSTVATLTATATAGRITRFEDVDVVVSNPRGTLRLFITTDQTTFYRSTVNGTCTTCVGGTYRNNVMTAQAMRFLTTDKKVYGNRTAAPNTGGLSAVVTVACDHEQVLCEMKSSLALPVLYSLGHEVMDNALVSFERWNVKDYRKEDIKDRRDQLAALYSDAISNVLKNAAVPMDPFCFECDKRITTATFYPSM